MKRELFLSIPKDLFLLSEREKDRRQTDRHTRVRERVSERVGVCV
jgi:hypothetical protein